MRVRNIQYERLVKTNLYENDEVGFFRLWSQEVLSRLSGIPLHFIGRLKYSQGVAPIDSFFMENLLSKLTYKIFENIKDNVDDFLPMCYVK